MALADIDKTQVRLLHDRYGHTAEQIADGLKLPLVDVQEFLSINHSTATILDRVLASPTGWVDRGESRTWNKAASDVEKDGYYTVTYYPASDLLECTCKGFRYRSTCDHVKIRRQMGVDN